MKLEGKVVGTFSRVASIVKESVREALVQVNRLNIQQNNATARFVYFCQDSVSCSHSELYEFCNLDHY